MHTPPMPQPWQMASFLLDFPALGLISVPFRLSPSFVLPEFPLLTLALQKGGHRAKRLQRLIADFCSTERKITPAHCRGMDDDTSSSFHLPTEQSLNKAVPFRAEAKVGLGWLGLSSPQQILYWLYKFNILTPKGKEAGGTYTVCRRPHVQSLVSSSPYQMAHQPLSFPMVGLEKAMEDGAEPGPLKDPREGPPFCTGSPEQPILIYRKG